MVFFERLLVASDTLESFYERPDAEASPLPLPAGWEFDWSTGTGEIYYINVATGESTYERPWQPAIEIDPSGK